MVFDKIIEQSTTPRDLKAEMREELSTFIDEEKFKDEMKQKFNQEDPNAFQ